MKCKKDTNGEIIATVTIEFIPDFRLTAKRREACWEQMGAQVSDGFGESYDRSDIPNVDSHYRLWI